MGMKVTIAEAIRLVAMRAGKSIAQVSRDMGMKASSNLVNMMARGDVKSSVLTRIADVCGYELALIPKGEDTENVITIKEDEKCRYSSD